MTPMSIISYAGRTALILRVEGDDAVLAQACFETLRVPIADIELADAPTVNALNGADELIAEKASYAKLRQQERRERAG